MGSFWGNGAGASRGLGVQGQDGVALGPAIRRGPGLLCVEGRAGAHPARTRA